MMNYLKPFEKPLFINRPPLIENENELHSENKNQKPIAPFIINSLPKSGTHLLTKALELFPGIKSSGIWIEHAKVKKYQHADGNNSITIPIGVDWPQQVNLSRVEKELRQIKSGHFLIGHIPHSQELSETIGNSRLKTIILVIQ